MIPKFIEDLEREISDFPVKKYSQIGEEGVILAICKLLKIEKGTFIDFGAGDGSMSNVRLLHEMGWKGMGYEGMELPGNTLEWLKPGTWITKENANNLYVEALHKAGVETEWSEDVTKESFCDFSFMSIDLDGNDYWILKDILSCNSCPKIICAEINGNIPAYPAVTIAYDENHRFGNDDYYGMSYGAFCELVEANGYKVVLNQGGLNAWAVMADLLPENWDYRPEPIVRRGWGKSTREGQNWVNV